MMIATAEVGEEIYRLAAELYPICRSITGPGVRETLARIARRIDLTAHEVPTGTPVLDWFVPKEWVIRDAYIADAAGRRLVDFKAHNLHVLNYSVPVRTKLPLAELKKHVFTLPEQADVIPYRTSYYAERWGFCMSHKALEMLPEGEYEAVVDSELKDGSLVYGEYLHRGQSEEEFLLSAHICHPSLANDNCSGLALLTVLAESLKGVKTRLSYRFIFAPGTIGSIAWLALNEDKVARIKAGVVVSGVGDAGGPTYKRSRRGDALIDRAMAHAIRRQGPAPKVIDFFPYGYDERQFCSPGFDLPVGLLQRSQFATFPEYHTSADNLSFIAPEHLAASFEAVATGIEIVERNRSLRNLVAKGEPQLGRRGLYGAIGGDKDVYIKNMAMLWVLNLSDGTHSLLDIAERADLPFQIVEETARVLEDAGLLA
jgi:aminopeptidase-like protein